MRYLTRPKQSGFTLVELLIVVIILAVLAAIVVPQFSSTTDDARTSTMQSNLASMRSAMELYRIQHGEYPGKAPASPGSGCTTPATGFGGSATTGQAFSAQLLTYTNSLGQICGAKSAVFKFGPYIKGGSMPGNEASGVAANTVMVVPEANDGMVVLESLSTLSGWLVDTESGLIVVNHSQFDHL